MTTTLHFYPAINAGESVCVKHHEDTTWVSVVSSDTHVTVYVEADELKRLISEAQAALREIETREKTAC